MATTAAATNDDNNNASNTQQQQQQQQPRVHTIPTIRAMKTLTQNQQLAYFPDHLVFLSSCHYTYRPTDAARSSSSVCPQCRPREAGAGVRADQAESRKGQGGHPPIFVGQVTPSVS